MNYKFSNMNKSLLLLVSLLMLLSCNFNPFQSEEDIWDGKIYTIPELFDSEIAQDGHTYLVKGYIFELNYSLEEEDFLFFPDINVNRDLAYHNIDITVVSNVNTIFNKIINAFDNTDDEWIPVTVRGKAKEITIYGNGWSDEIFILEIDALKTND